MPKSNQLANTSLLFNNDVKEIPKIIQCPACQTKFALSPENLKEQSNPKFHCSRCDYLFHTDLGIKSRVEKDVLPQKSKDNTLDQEQIKFDFVSKFSNEETLETNIKETKKEIDSIKIPTSFTKEEDPIVHNNNFKPTKRTENKYGIKLILYAVAAISVLIIAFSILIKSSHNSNLKLINLLESDLSIVPANDLIISNIKYQEVFLQSGDSINEISATINNNSENSYKDILAELILYNDKSLPFYSQKFSIGNNLEDIKLYSLSRDQIDELQNKKIPKDFKLKAFEKTQSKILFDNDLIRDAKYFNLRVYSAKNTK